MDSRVARTPLTAASVSVALVLALAGLFALNRTAAGASQPGPLSSSPPAGAISLCDLTEVGPDEVCVVELAAPYGPWGPASAGEAGEPSPAPEPSPTTCPNPLPEPPSPDPDSALNGYLVCTSESPSPSPPTEPPPPPSPSEWPSAPPPPPPPTEFPPPFPSPSWVLAAHALDDEEPAKHISTTSFYWTGTKPFGGGDTTFKKGFLLLGAKDGVTEFNGIIVVEIKTKTPKGAETKQTVRFTSFSARGKFKDPNTGKEIDGFKAEKALSPELTLPAGTTVECTIKGVIGAVLLKDETTDRPLAFKKSEKFEFTVKE